MSLFKKGVAEFFGTLILVVMGCGVAVTTSRLGNLLTPGNNAAYVVATSLAFGLTIVALAYALGPVSGCHINPAVSLGVYVKGILTKDRSFGWKELLVYVVCQSLGALVGAYLLEGLFSQAGIDALGLGANQVQGFLVSGNDRGAITGSSLGIGFVAEALLSCLFVYAVLGVTAKKEYGGVAGLVIGGALTLVHLLGIELTGTSVNPARSVGPAIAALANGVTEPANELWLFIFAPLLGGVLAAVLFAYLNGGKEKPLSQA